MFRWPFRKREPAPAPSVGEKKPSDRDENQRGVALLLTLAALALLMVLAISFSFQSQTNLQGSQVNADTVRARLLAESALERAMAFIASWYPGQDDTGATSADMFPATKPSAIFFPGPNTGGNTAWAGRWYAVSRDATPDQAGIETALASNLAFDFTPSWQAQAGVPPAPTAPTMQTLNVNSSWHHISEDTDVNGNGRLDLLGRIAFLAIDESGKLDPTWSVSFHDPFVDANGNDAYDSGEFYWDLDGNGGYTAGAINEGAEVRIGGRPQEIDLEYALPAAIQGVRDGWRTLVPIVNSRPTGWFSWYHIKQGTAMSEQNAQLCTRTLFPFSYDIEAFHSGTAANTLDNEHHRFDLIGAQWNHAPPPPATPAAPTVIVSSLQLAAPAFWDTSVTPPIVKALQTSDRGGSIPWLSQMTAEDGATSVSNQVAANLIDYCDTDSISTSNYDSVALTATYAGDEQVPYINEIQIDLGLIPGFMGIPDTIMASVNVELVNIYSNNPNVTLWLRAVFSITGPGGPYTLTVQGGAGTLRYPNLISVGTNSYYRTPGGLAPSASLTTSGTSGTYQIRLTQIFVALSDGGDPGTVPDAGHLYDVFADTDTAGTWPAATLTPTGAGMLQCNSLEVKDPRANTNMTRGSTALWDWVSPVWVNGVGAAGSLGGRNASSDPRTGDDLETVNDPRLGVSTAFIRNGPPLSLWELGCIHRGEPWRTINLKAFNDGTDLTTKPATYANGDALILEQVKLGDPPITHGKVNANSPVGGVWQALLDQVYVGTKYDFSATGNAITPTSLLTGIAGKQPFTHRGQIADVTEFADGTGGVPQDTDAKQEEIIGKIANLLTVRQNFFTIIATGQAVKDLGTVDAPDSYEYATGKYCSVLAEQKIMAIVYRDAFTNKFKVVRWEYLDE